MYGWTRLNMLNHIEHTHQRNAQVHDTHVILHTSLSPSHESCTKNGVTICFDLRSIRHINRCTLDGAVLALTTAGTEAAPTRLAASGAGCVSQSLPGEDLQMHECDVASHSTASPELHSSLR